MKERFGHARVIGTNGYTVLYSYKTPVACVNHKDKENLKTKKVFSPTTSKHIEQFLDNNGYVEREIEEVEQEFFDETFSDIVYS